MTSLRRATISTLVVLLTIVGVLAGLASYWIAAKVANEFLDLQLREVAQIAGTATPLADGLPLHDIEDDLVIEIRFIDGRPAFCAPAPCRFPKRPEVGVTDIAAGGYSWRVFTLVLPDRTIQAGQRIEVRREMASGAALAAVLPMLLLIPVLWIVVDLVLRRAFRRVSQVAAEIAARDGSDVSLIPMDHVPAEMRLLVLAMNGLLARMRTLIDQQRAFVADAAHQLRTPLTALMLELENLRTARSGPVAAESLDFFEAAARRASALVAQLLRLARQEADARRGHEEVDLAEVVVATIGALAPLAISRRIDLGLLAKVEATVSGDREDFRALLETVLDNAVRYTPEGGTVDVEMRAEETGVAVFVRDTGPGIPAEALPRLFERFFRVEGQEAEGSGLGLAIADLIACRHGLHLSISNRADFQGTEVRLLFPAP